MSARAIELPAGIEHGTPEGHAAGCKSETTCPALFDHGMVCLYAKVRFESDVRYYRAKARDPHPAAIARALGFKPVPRPTEAPVAPVAALAPPAVVAAKPRKPKVKPAAAVDDDAIAAAIADEIQLELPTAPVEDRELHAEPASEHEPEPAANVATDPVDEGTPDSNEPAGDARTSERTDPPAPVEPKPMASDGPSQAEVRAWAKRVGLDVNPRGSVRRDIVQAYLDAQEFASAAKPVATSPEPANEPPDSSHVVEVAGGRHSANENRWSELDGPVTVAPTHFGVDWPHPGWAEVTVSEDVEAARATAVRLEQELAHTTEQLTAALAACDVAVHHWGKAIDQVRILEGNLAAERVSAIQQRSALVRQVTRLVVANGTLQRRITTLKTALDETRSIRLPWRRKVGL